MSKFMKSILLVMIILVAAVPALFAQKEQSIVDIAVADGRFTTLVAAVVAADLADALSGGNWTVFAPTDDAFAKLGLNADNIADAFTTEELTDILLYHALGSEVTSAKAKTLLGDVRMANGQIAGLKFFSGSLYVNDDSKVIIPDIDASNGVIHVVDTVILGPWPRTGN
jgi:transforming growth factor-beta-induced protein